MYRQSTPVSTLCSLTAVGFHSRLELAQNFIFVKAVRDFRNY